MRGHTLSIQFPQTPRLIHMSHRHPHLAPSVLDPAPKIATLEAGAAPQGGRGLSVGVFEISAWAGFEDPVRSPSPPRNRCPTPTSQATRRPTDGSTPRRHTPTSLGKLLNPCRPLHALDSWSYQWLTSHAVFSHWVQSSPVQVFILLLLFTPSFVLLSWQLSSSVGARRGRVAQGRVGRARGRSGAGADARRANKASSSCRDH